MGLLGGFVLLSYLYLGVSALISPLRVHHQVIRREMPVVLLASIVFAAFLRSGGGLARWEGIVLLAGGLTHVATTVLSGLRREGTTGGGTAVGAGSVPLRLLLVLLGLAVLLYGADLLVSNAVTLAHGFGMSEAVIGVTIVAVGTSAPELATSVVASLRREADIAVARDLVARMLT